MEKTLETFVPYLSQLGVRDAHKMSRTLNSLIKRRDENLPYDKKLAHFEDELARALDKASARLLKIPPISFPDQLPVSQKKDEIAEAISSHQVVILAGETGSGKTTQLPKICLSIGRGVKGRIGHTQPRRIAARTVASRIAEELETNLGEAVGYQVRFTDHTNEDTFIKLMTDGILLAEIQNDPLLLNYDTLIIDEAHERSLNIDFLLGYLKRLLKKRPDLKLIVTSATIDVERFSIHFDKAPIIEVSGRTFPVQTIYRPWQDQHDDINEGIVASIQEILTTQTSGDILVFLSGEREIREASYAIKKANFPHLNILPLYARLSLAEQNKVFHTSKGRRVVLATNVAETSITVPGIKYVIDPGYARVSRYSVRTKVQRLPIEAISQASANQRQGRCGRVSNGVCYRLYSEEDFNSRPEFTDAEIVRTNLAAVILQMLHMRIGDIRDFPFVDRPDKRFINDGFKLLEEVKAVNKFGKVSTLGRSLHQLPIDPRLGAVIIEANKLGCLREALIIVSALSIQDPRDRPADKKQAADEKHRRFFDEHSDFIAYINLWDYFETQRQDLSQSQLRKLCQKEFINYLRMREWRDLHHQLKLAIKKLDYKENHQGANYETIHRALICGYLSQVGNKDSESKSREYFGTRQKKFLIFPGSSQTKKKHKWILAAQFIETSQLFAHCVAKVEPEWVLAYADHLSKKHYFEPHYDVKMGAVRAFVRTTLFGLVLQEKKRVAYNKINADEAHEIFLRQALVEGKYRGKGEFFKHNLQLIEDIHELEAKSRRRDIMVDEERIFEFYRTNVPAHISNLSGFEHWRKEAEKQDSKILFLSKETLMLHDAGQISKQQFPNELSLGDYAVSVSYCFEPGKVNDGVNIQVPVDILHGLSEEMLEWGVPGILRDKCIALVKSLPKATRKNLVPVPQFVDRVMPRLKPGNLRLTQALGEALGHISGVDIPQEQWDMSAIEDFYRINIQIVDDQNKVIDQSRYLDQLKNKHRSRVQKTLAKAGDGIERENITQWDFGRFSHSVLLNKGKVKIKAYPALINNTDSVELKVLDNPDEARFNTHFGMLRLAAFECHQTVKYLKKNLMKGKDLGLTVVNIGRREQVIDDIILAAIDDAIFRGEELPQEKDDFKHKVNQGRSDIVAAAEHYEALLAKSLSSLVEIKKRIKTHKNPLAIALAANDISAQMERLFFTGVFTKTPKSWLDQYPRYLSAVHVRLDKMGQSPTRDNAWTETLNQLWDAHQTRLQKEGEWAYTQNTQWQKYRWMIEELRVSLFAQTLKTAMPVSEKRLQKQWQLSLE
ncbi:ATP-dependent RNA helicase HrpA [Agarilytica rhodophyticola]|uniref:ATP-dependent RNA helicase HrpA n=1 Tax=Agarilytica rhodophyticola TaxID=1737490 RepID=UPI000B349F66|nr:ATP-dependent RNA helicase HrpA [Agarilytica rhodophyticola]